MSYVLNSNDSYWLANPDAPITGITPLIGLERTDPGHAGPAQGNLMVHEVLSGGGRFTLGALQSLFQNDRNYLAELVSGAARGPLRREPERDADERGDREHLRGLPDPPANYDNTGNLDSTGAWLFAAYQRRAPSAARTSGPTPSTPTTRSTPPTS